MARGSEATKLLLDGQTYRIRVWRARTLPPEAPRLVLVSFMPNAAAEAICKICVQGIISFTPEPHELWVVDNCSPQAHRAWLKELEGVNLVLNDTIPLPPAERGIFRRWFRRPDQRRFASYANAVGLELAVRLVDAESAYFMSLHMDTFPCRKGWLTFLKSKLTGNVAAAGVRMDRARTPSGVLHVLGCLVQFQVFRRLNLDYWPHLPERDVGDSVSIGLCAAGYELFACRNTLWDPELVKLIPEGSPFRELRADRSFDDDGNVIFLHLGRGVHKSEGRFAGGVTPEDWVRFCEQVLSTPTC